MQHFDHIIAAIRPGLFAIVLSDSNWDAILAFKHYNKLPF